MSWRHAQTTAGILVSALLAAGWVLSCGRNDAPSATAKPAPVISSKSGVPMVAVPGGWFEMGSGREPDETPHRVYVSPFCMDQFEVTQEDFEKVLGRNPSRWTEPKNPVEQIRWKDAAEYCNARSRLDGLIPCYAPETWKCNFEANGYRLPTEAEWEYACRAGTRTQYSFGDDSAELGKYAWFKGNCTRSSQAVGRKRANAWGLNDMHGNVWEWCNDFYQANYYRQSPARDPRGPETGQTRVLRGGCWNSRPDTCRSAYRLDEAPAYSDTCFARDVHGLVGFRCVRSQSPAR